MTMLPDICIPLSALRTSLTLWSPSPFETGGTSILTRNEHFIVDILFVKSNEPLVTWVKTFQMFCFWMNQSRYLYYHCGFCFKRETIKSKKLEKALVSTRIKEATGNQCLLCIVSFCYFPSRQCVSMDVCP